MAAQLSPGFVSLQLALVDRFVALGCGSWVDGANRVTNLQRRLGLGSATDPASGHRWVDLLKTLANLTSAAHRVDAVMDAAASLPPPVPEHIAHGWPTVGAFSVEIRGRTARTHFYSTDDDDLSPLHPGKLDRRRRELMEVLSVVCDEHPDIERVAGGSWLYSTRSYASLFPPTHVANAVVRRGRTTFHGMSHWGQFVDHRGHLRTEFAERFLQRLETWTGDDPCALFPIATLDVDSPVAAFDLR